MHPAHLSSVHKPAPSLKEKIGIENTNGNIDGLHDNYVRLMADFENYKRRSGLERQRTIEAADEQLVTELIDIRSAFERAFSSSDRGAAFALGMELNVAKLNAILKNHGLESFGCAGAKFDPRLHDALICAPSTVLDSHISEVLEPGYMIRGKIIRHAKVAVSSGEG